MVAAMADNNSRWERLTEKPVDKPAFSARQSTESFRQPEGDRAHRAHRSRRHGRARSGKIWYLIGIIVLSLLTAILAWQLFGT
jgi:hypothetical protein